MKPGHTGHFSSKICAGNQDLSEATCPKLNRKRKRSIRINCKILAPGKLHSPHLLKANILKKSRESRREPEMR